jgi:hypothetical protein
MADPVNNQQQPIGLEVNATLRTKEGLYLQGVRFNSTACKFLVLKSTYVNGSNPKQECYLTANFTTQGANRGITLHLFDALNAPNWKIDDWSKVVKTKLNTNKLRKPTQDESILIEALKKNEKDVGLQVFWKNPTVVEAAFSLNNPQTGTNSANKQNQIDNGMGSKPKQPNAAVQGAIEGMSEKNPALESTEMIFDRLIRESLESDKEEFIKYINNIFDDTNCIPVGKCSECGLMLTNEDELEDGTHECPKCSSILEDKLDFWEIED